MSSQNVTRITARRSPRCALDIAAPQDIGRNPPSTFATRGSIRSSNNHRQQYPRRSFFTRSLHLASSLSLILLILASVLVGGAAARPDANNVDLVIDRRGAPARGNILLERSAFAQQDDNDEPSTTSSRSTSASSTSSSSLQPTESSALAIDDSADDSVDLPQPFDGAPISTNLTADCTTFLKTFLAAEDFTSCHPLSFLLANSESFFGTLKKGAFAITKALDATCSADVDTCSSVLSQYEADLTSPNNCQSDYDAGNPLVHEAAAAFAAYKTLYTAGCLKSKQGNYCYTEASTSTEFPNDPSVYFLPLGTELPTDTVVSCSECMKNTLAIYSTTGSNSSSPLAQTYKAAAEQINELCGSGYAEESMLIQEEGSATRSATSFMTVVVAAGVALVLGA